MPPRSSHLPDFLIVGAMKAGTTTLYRDLAPHPEIFLPAEKEPETLVRFGDHVDAVRRDYRSLFAPAPKGAIKGEASTAYTKRPTFDGAAAMAKHLCGPDLKIIYLRRDPVKRIVSHYKHAVVEGATDLPFQAAIEADPLYIAISRYDWQIAPWIEAFGEAAVLQLEFETYVHDRQGVAGQVCTFIGADPAKLPAIAPDIAFNASDHKAVARSGLARNLLESRLYQRILKPLISPNLRDRARALLPKAGVVDVTLSPGAESKLRTETARWPT